MVKIHCIHIGGCKGRVKGSKPALILKRKFIIDLVNQEMLSVILNLLNLSGGNLF